MSKKEKFPLSIVVSVTMAVLTGCSNDNSPIAKNYYLTPEVQGGNAVGSSVDLASGSLLKRSSDLSISTVAFSRSLISKGISDPSFGGWQHNYASSLDKGGLDYDEWQGIKSSRYEDAEQACDDGWDNIKNSAYNGQLTAATPIFHEGLCDLYLDSEIVASLPVRNAGDDNPFPLHTLVQADGSTITFFKKGDVWTSTTRSQMKLSKNGGTWEVETASNAIQSYNEEGQLTKITNAAGQVTTLSYVDDLLTTVKGAFGHTLTLSYDNDKIAGVTSAAGEVSYQYDADGKLATVTGVDGGETAYSYTDGKLVSITNPAGSIIASYDYDSEGRVISTAGANGSQAKDISYASSGVSITDRQNQQTDTYEFAVSRGEMKVVRVSDTDGDTEVREYDANGYPSKVIAKNGNVTTTTYNERGLLVSRTELAGTANARTSLTEWHPDYNKPTKQVEPGKAIFSDYNDQGLLVSRVEGTVNPAERGLAARGVSELSLLKRTALREDTARKTSFEYTAQGQSKGAIAANGATTAYDYDDNGNRISTKNALGQESKVLEFDAAGRALKTQDANGSTTESTYDKAGRTLTTTRDGQVTYYEYDTAGRQVKTRYPDGSESSREYDAAGNLAKTIDHEGNTTENTYDNSGNQLTTRVVDASGTVLLSSSSEYNAKSQLVRSIDAGGNTTQFEYDKDGNQVKITDANGNVSRNEYDAQNRLTKSIDALGGETHYEYDINGNRTKVTAPNGAVTEFTYDNFNQLTAEISADRGETTYAYDVSGSQSAITTANGDTKRISYDLLGRKVGETWDNNPDLTVTYTYDNCDNGIGKLCTITDNTGSMTYAYNESGQVIEKASIIDGVTLSKQYTYNAQDKLVSQTYPSGKVISYTYDVDQLTSISVDGAVIISDITYSASDQLMGWKWSDGSAYTKTYDESGRLSTFPLADETRTLQYDALGNITGWNDSDSEEYKRFDYDVLNRLTRFNENQQAVKTDDNGVETPVVEQLQKQVFEYDANGNRLALTDGVAETPIKTIYDILEDSNRLSSVGDTEYQYDASGNIINDGEHDYHYDACNRLTKVDDNHQYFYNASNMRVKKVSDGNTTLYGWDNERIYAEYDASGTAIQETVYFGSTPIALLKDNNVYRIFADQIDTPRVIANQDNEPQWSWESKPFGETLPDEDVDKDGLSLSYNLRFPGQYYDQETKKHYNFNRDYNPVTGRYVQSDPIGLEGGMNTFVYVNGKPLMYIDSRGLSYRPQWTLGHGDLIAGSDVYLEGFILDMPLGSPTIYDYNMHCMPMNQNPAPGQEESHVCAGVGSIPSSVDVGDVDYFRMGGTWYKIPAGGVLITIIPFTNYYDITGAVFYDVNGWIGEMHKGAIPRNYVNRVVDEVYPWMPYTFE